MRIEENGEKDEIMCFQSLDISTYKPMRMEKKDTQNLGSSSTHIMSMWVLACSMVLDMTFNQIDKCFFKTQKKLTCLIIKPMNCARAQRYLNNCNKGLCTVVSQTTFLNESVVVYTWAKM